MSLPFITLDLTPRFLTFYAAARHEPNPEQRWVSWQTHYAFAAVPPTPAGQAMARQLLDAAWPRYEAALPLIQRGAADLFADAETELRRVQTLLETPNLLPTRVIGYVGAFENNAFVARQGETLNVCLPVETPRETRLPLLAHELTHVVHCAAGGSDGEWTRSLASSLLAEGLAMRVTQQLFPDAPLAQVVGEAAWLAACAAKESALLSAMQNVLNDDSDEVTVRFVLGPGAAGLLREAYYAGWVLVGDLLTEGLTPARLADLPIAAAPEVIEAALRARLARLD